MDFIKRKIKDTSSQIGKMIFRQPDWKKWGVFLFLVLVTGIFLWGNVAKADLTTEGLFNTLTSWVTTGLLGIGAVLMKMAIFCLEFFIALAQYNDYVNAPTVEIGWYMVRDVANMFFVVVLLIIAIGTILGIENYQWNKTLIKFIFAAIFINFSNLICGIMIDIAHVFTITFVNAVSATAGGNLVAMFKMEEIYTIINNKPADSGTFQIDILVGAFIAVIFSLLTLLAMGSYLIIMLIRMVALWVLIILSPLAFILQAIPQGASYAKQWWSYFGKYVFVAPVIVFFLWLSFATLGTGNVLDHVAGDFGIAALSEIASTPQSLDATISVTAVSTWKNMASFLIPLALMGVGISIVQKIGVMGGGLLGGAVNFAKKVATYASGYYLGRKMVEGGLRGVGRGALKSGKFLGKTALYKAPVIGGKHWERRGRLAWRGMKRWGRGMSDKPEGIAGKFVMGALSPLQAVTKWFAHREAMHQKFLRVSEKVDEDQTSLMSKRVTSYKHGARARELKGKLAAYEERSQEREKMESDKSKVEEQSKMREQHRFASYIDKETGKRKPYKLALLFGITRREDRTEQGTMAEDIAKHRVGAVFQAERKKEMDAAAERKIEQKGIKEVDAIAGTTKALERNRMSAEEKELTDKISADRESVAGREKQLTDEANARFNKVKKDKGYDKDEEALDKRREAHSEGLEKYKQSEIVREALKDASVVAAQNQSISFKKQQIALKTEEDQLEKKQKAEGLTPDEVQKLDGIRADIKTNEGEIKAADELGEETLDQVVASMDGGAELLKERDRLKAEKDSIDVDAKDLEVWMGGKTEMIDGEEVTVGGDEDLKAIQEDLDKGMKVVGDAERQIHENVNELNRLRKAREAGESTEDRLAYEDRVVLLEEGEGALRQRLQDRGLTKKKEIESYIEKQKRDVVVAMAQSEARAKAEKEEEPGKEEEDISEQIATEDRKVLAEEGDRALAKRLASRGITGKRQVNKLTKKYEKENKKAEEDRIANEDKAFLLNGEGPGWAEGEGGGWGHFEERMAKRRIDSDGAWKLFNKYKKDIKTEAEEKVDADIERQSVGYRDILRNQDETALREQLSLDGFGDKDGDEINELVAQYTEDNKKADEEQVAEEDKRVLKTGGKYDLDNRLKARGITDRKQRKALIEKYEKEIGEGVIAEQADDVGSEDKLVLLNEGEDALRKRLAARGITDEAQAKKLISQYKDEIYKDTKEEGEWEGLTTLAGRRAKQERVAERETAGLEEEKSQMKRKALGLESIGQIFNDTVASELGKTAADSFIERIKQDKMSALFTAGLADMKKKIKEAAKLGIKVEDIEFTNKGAQAAQAQYLSEYYKNLADLDQKRATDEMDTKFSEERLGSSTPASAYKSLVKRRIDETFQGVEREQAVTMALGSLGHLISAKRNGVTLASDQTAQMMANTQYLVSQAWHDDLLDHLVRKIRAYDAGDITDAKEREEAGHLKDIFINELKWGKVDKDTGKVVKSFTNRSGADRANELQRLQAAAGDVGAIQSENAVLKVRRKTGKKYDESADYIADEMRKSGIVDESGNFDLSMSEKSLNRALSSLGQKIGVTGDTAVNELKAFAENVLQVSQKSGETASGVFKGMMGQYQEAMEILSDFKHISMGVGHIDDAGHTFYDAEAKMFRGQLHRDATKFMLGDWNKVDARKKATSLKTHSITRMNEDHGTASHWDKEAYEVTFAGFTNERLVEQLEDRNVRHLTFRSATEEIQKDSDGRYMIAHAGSDLVQKTLMSQGYSEQEAQIIAIKTIARDAKIGMKHEYQVLTSLLGKMTGLKWDESIGQGRLHLNVAEGTEYAAEIDSIDGFVKWINKVVGEEEEYIRDSRMLFPEEDHREHFVLSNNDISTDPKKLGKAGGSAPASAAPASAAPASAAPASAAPASAAPASAAPASAAPASAAPASAAPEFSMSDFKESVRTGVEAALGKIPPIDVRGIEEAVRMGFEKVTKTSSIEDTASSSGSSTGRVSGKKEPSDFWEIFG